MLREGLTARNRDFSSKLPSGATYTAVKLTIETPMWRALSSCLALALGALAYVSVPSVSLSASQNPPATGTAPASTRGVLNKYCVSCHNGKLRVGGFALDSLNAEDVSADPEAWENVVRKLRSGAMPPAGRPRPDTATYDAVASGLEARLDAAVSSHPEPGRLPLFHRLTRTEYKNAIRDLLGLDDLAKDADLDRLLPADNASSGFDNIADLLFVSSTQLEQYLSAAHKLSSVAIGDPSVPPLVDTYRMSDQFNQEYQAEGAPFGTRGGSVIRTYLPLDGDYRIHIELADAPRERHELEIAVDDERVALIPVDLQSITAASAEPRGGDAAADAGTSSVAETLDEIATPIKINSVVNRRFELDRRTEARRRAIEKGFDVDLPLKAGPRAITVAFLKRTSAKGESLIRPRLRGRGQLPAVASVTIRGPYKVAGSGDTPSRRRILVCHPAASSEEAACAKKILSTLARRAYRRPVTDLDLQPLLSIYAAERRTEGFEAALRPAIERVLVSPQFLFRIERQPVKVAAGTAYRISDLELASRLSFFLWSSIPDDELLGLAERGTLGTRSVLEQQVRRMLRDPRAEALATNFAAQWLYLRDVHAKTPNPRLFPDFDLSLREALERETTLFLSSVFRDDRSVVDLLSANDTFMNERLARHYGVPNVVGNDFRRVSHPDDSPRRGLGLLGHGSILTLTSYANRTSPVLRGKYVLGNLLGAPSTISTRSEDGGRSMRLVPRSIRLARCPTAHDSKVSPDSGRCC
jgi:hypothetical protein